MADPLTNAAVQPAASLPTPDASVALPGAEAMAAPGRMAELVELVDMGGPVVWILMLMSVVALAILLVKLWQYHRLQLHRSPLSRELLALHRAGEGQQALVRAAASRQPAARLVALAIRSGLAESRHPAAVREELARLGNQYVALMRSYLRPLEMIAALAPLLGLFGTVLGMISAFQALQTAGSRVDPGVLAGGIWEALLTTAVGLAVAMPVLALLTWLEGRAERTARDIENAVTQVFTPDLGS